MNRRLIQLALGIVASSALIVLLARTIDTGVVASAVQAADVRLILLGVTVHLLAMWFRALLWRRLLAVPASTALLFKVSIVGFAVSYIMPLRVGEVARAYLMARWRGIAYGTTVASLVAERVLDGLSVGAILLTALIFVPAPAYVLALGLGVGGIFGGLAAVLIAMSWRAGSVTSLASALSRLLPERARATVQRLAHGFAIGLEPLRNWRALPTLVGLSLVGWLCQFLVFFILMLAFALPASVPVALVIGGVTNFATLLPSAPGNVGTFDAAVIKLLMDLQGISLANAAAYALVVHAVIVVPVVALGGLVMWRSDVSLSQIIGRSLRWPRAATVAPLAVSGGTSAASL